MIANPNPHRMKIPTLFRRNRTFLDYTPAQIAELYSENQILKYQNQCLKSRLGIKEGQEIMRVHRDYYITDEDLIE